MKTNLLSYINFSKVSSQNSIFYPIFLFVLIEVYILHPIFTHHFLFPFRCFVLILFNKMLNWEILQSRDLIQ